MTQDVENHAALLCSLLLGFGMNAYVCLGTKNKSSPHAWVATIGSDDGAVTFWESLSSNRFVWIHRWSQRLCNFVPHRPCHMETSFFTHFSGVKYFKLANCPSLLSSVNAITASLTGYWLFWAANQNSTVTLQCCLKLYSELVCLQIYPQAYNSEWDACEPTTSTETSVQNCRMCVQSQVILCKYPGNYVFNLLHYSTPWLCLELRCRWYGLSYLSRFSSYYGTISATDKSLHSFSNRCEFPVRFICIL